MAKSKEELEGAANEIIKTNRKFWVGVIVGAGVVLTINAFFIIGKWIG